jgi:hypothetical protein
MTPVVEILSESEPTVTDHLKEFLASQAAKAERTELENPPEDGQVLQNKNERIRIILFNSV